MAHKILLIESDQAFAGRISRSLEASGFEVRIAADGKEGLELARDAAPHAIVLCVELAGMSGYLVCQKLKKDDALKAIPLVLTSAEATQETFDKHRTLKARADEYLLKPYEPAALAEKLRALLGLPADGFAAEALEEGEILTLEEEMDAPAEEPGAGIDGLDVRSLPDEPPAADEGDVDEDLRLLDDAFESLAAPSAASDAAAALDALGAEGPPRAGSGLSPPAARDGGGAAAAGALGDGDAGLDELDGTEGLEPLDLGDEAGAPRGAPRGAPAVARGADATDADLALADLAALAGEGGAGEASERNGGRDRDGTSFRGTTAAEDGAAAARAQAEAAEERLRAADASARAARDEARRAEERARAAESEAAQLRRKLAEAEHRAAAAEAEARQKAAEAAAAAGAAAKADALEREIEALRTELLVARGEAEGARGEIERRTAELKRRLGEVEAANAKNEERVVKAYQKIKADEKVREKVRKALAIATQLLDEGLPESPAERERRAALANRE